jgi:hypothetical protein
MQQGENNQKENALIQFFSLGFRRRNSQARIFFFFPRKKKA